MDREDALTAISDAVLAIASELAVEPVLRRMVDTARDLTGARYAALGLPDEGEGFARFITSGMTDEEITAIGPLPRKHGMLGAMLQDTHPFRTEDIQEDPRFWGWPEAHPDMHSFLGVPIVSGGEVIASFYLTDKQGAPEFTEGDQRLIEMLAAHAAIAIQNARLYERSRELSVVEERNRLARDLHDSVVQRLFSVILTAEAALAHVDKDPAQAREQLERVRDLARDAAQEMRSLIFELRPAELEADGLVPTLAKHIDVLRRVRGADIRLAVEGERRFRKDAEKEVYRIAQEAINNALKHAGATRIEVDLRILAKAVELAVRDDGSGFDPADPSLRAKRLGLTLMEERAEAIGGALAIDSHAGGGTAVTLRAPLR